MILVTFHGLCGTFEKIEIIKFSIIEMEILRKYLDMQKWRARYGRKLRLQFQKNKFWAHKMLNGKH